MSSPNARTYHYRFIVECAVTRLLQLFMTGMFATVILGLALVGAIVRGHLFFQYHSLWDFLLCLVATVAFSYFGRCFLIGVRDEWICRVVPYFEREVGLGIVDGPFSCGVHLARNCLLLDQVAVQTGILPISYFGYRDDGRWVKWHDAQKAIDTVNALKGHPTVVAVGEPLLKDLEVLLTALTKARDQHIRFCLIVRPGLDKFISPVEMDGRKGKFW